MVDLARHKARAGRVEDPIRYGEELLKRGRGMMEGEKAGQ